MWTNRLCELRPPGDKIGTSYYLDTKDGWSRSNTILYSISLLLLSVDSCHPIHTIKAIPITELIIAKRNCSLTSEFVAETTGIYNRFKQWKYFMWMWDRELKKVINIPKNKLLAEKRVSQRTDKKILTNQ